MRIRSLLAVFAIFAFVLIAGCVQQPSNNSGTYRPPGSANNTGRALFAVADAAADMGSVSSVKVTVDKVEVHSTADNWTTVSTETKTYDLMQLKASGNNALLADAKLAEGTYNQVRLHVTNATVVDASGSHTAKLPSNELKIVGEFDVAADSTSTALLDFQTSDSLHVAGNGTYVFAPVVRYETRNDAEVKVNSENDVEIGGGNIKTNSLVGMDLNGKIGIGIQVPANAVIEINSNGGIAIGGTGSGSGRIVVGITDAAANMDSVSKIQLTVDKVEVHSTADNWTTVSTETKTYDLMQLNSQSKTALLADAQVKEGTYDQIRLNVTNVTLVVANGSHDAKLPSNELKIMGNFDVNANQASSATLDFIASDSLHVTGKGEYILAPVIQVQTRDNANVEVKEDDSVELSGGTIRTNDRIGMDENGNIGIGVSIPADTDLSIENGRIKVNIKVKVSIGGGYN